MSLGLLVIAFTLGWFAHSVKVARQVRRDILPRLQQMQDMIVNRHKSGLP